MRVEGLSKLFHLPCPSRRTWGPNKAGPRAPVARTPVLAPPSPEAVRQLPLFGYTVYVVLRVSEVALPGPGFLGLNRQHIILMDPSSQVGQVPAPGQAWAPLGQSSPTTYTDPSPERSQALLSLLPPETVLLCCPEGTAADPPAEPTGGTGVPWPGTQLWLG